MGHRSFTTAWVVLKSMRIQRFWVQVVKFLAVCIVEVKLQVVFMAATVWVVILFLIVWFSDAYLDERLPVTLLLPTLSTSRVWGPKLRPNSDVLTFLVSLIIVASSCVSFCVHFEDYYSSGLARVK